MYTTYDPMPNYPPPLPPPEPVLSIRPWEIVREYTSWAAVRLRVAAAVRRERIAVTEDELPRWRQTMRRVGGVAASTAIAFVAVQAYRATGAAAHSLEEIGLLDGMGVSNGVVAVSPAEIPEGSLQTATQVVEATPRKHTEVSYVPEAKKTHDKDALSLSADIDKAPARRELGGYKRSTGEGTIWHQTVEYADELGYDNLTGRQKWQLTDRVLELNNLSWADARDLPQSYRPKMPTQRTMEEVLERFGADRTHAADRPSQVVTPAPTPPSPVDPDLPAKDVPPVTIATEPCNINPGYWFSHGNPFYDCDWNAKDFWTAAGLAGVLVVTYGAQKQVFDPWFIEQGWKGPRQRTVHETQVVTETEAGEKDKPRRGKGLFAKAAVTAGAVALWRRLRSRHRRTTQPPPIPPVQESAPRS
ncbi:MAG TPA: hypothetical protein VJ836_00505 [Candidatus Saccharimonadales bacterium]|nr:hypothetical protein [Candidatus Saccharimonadales bacterium]